MTVLISSQKPVPRAFFVSAKNAVLGKTYELDVAFVNEKEIQRLNSIYRNEDKPTDILSFPLSKEEGEIVLCMKEVEAHAPRFSRTPSNFLKFLFIHGLCHLKGMTHGGRMEREEEKFRKKFNI